MLSTSSGRWYVAVLLRTLTNSGARGEQYCFGQPSPVLRIGHFLCRVSLCRRWVAQRLTAQTAQLCFACQPCATKKSYR